VACPACPPTWNSDCAKPCRPPDAARAMRVASGWKIDEPVPTIAAPVNRPMKLDACASISRPTSVQAMPIMPE
jgi:hypothetical protein